MNTTDTEEAFQFTMRHGPHRRSYHYADGSWITPAGRNNFGGRWEIIGPPTGLYRSPAYRLITDENLKGAMHTRHLLATGQITDGRG